MLRFGASYIRDLTVHVVFSPCNDKLPFDHSYHNNVYTHVNEPDVWTDIDLGNGLLHSMMTSSNGNFSALLAICAGNSPVTGEFPTQRPVTRSFDVFLDLRLNKRLSKQSWGWWFEGPSCSLWRHCNGLELFTSVHNRTPCVNNSSTSWPSWHCIGGSDFDWSFLPRLINR